MENKTKVVKYKGENMDAKQQAIEAIDKLREVEKELYHQLEKAEHTAGILRCRKDDDRRKTPSCGFLGPVVRLLPQDRPRL